MTKETAVKIIQDTRRVICETVLASEVYSIERDAIRSLSNSIREKAEKERSEHGFPINISVWNEKADGYDAYAKELTSLVIQNADFAKSTLTQAWRTLIQIGYAPPEGVKPDAPALMRLCEELTGEKFDDSILESDLLN